MKRAGRNLVLESALILGGLAAVAILVLGSAAMSYSTSIIRRNLQEEALRTSEEIRDVLVTPLYTLSDDTVKSVAEAYLSAGSLDGMRVESYATGVLVMREPSDAGILGPYYHEISLEDMQLGNVTLWFNDRRARDMQKELLISIGVTTLGTVVVVVLSVLLVLRFKLLSALRGVFDGIGKISQGMYDHRVPATAFADANRIVDLINGMSGAILAKESALRSLNESLEKQVEDRTRRLRIASDKLRTAERMMALGTLVAGISHELNTPLGTALTAISYLQDRPLGLPEPALESVDLARRNLDRAISLVKTFRQVATDQSGTGDQTFCLRKAVTTALDTIRPRLDRRGITVRIEGENFDVHTYRDAIWPIVTNLAFNASSHAYKGEGEILFRLTRRGDQACIEYSDTGAGMEQEVRARAFEPFFTTKRGRGGIGLGMYVLYNLATDRLGGTIDLESKPGQGTSIRIAFPMRRPINTDPTP